MSGKAAPDAATVQTPAPTPSDGAGAAAAATPTPTPTPAPAQPSAETAAAAAATATTTNKETPKEREQRLLIEKMTKEHNELLREKNIQKNAQYLKLAEQLGHLIAEHVSDSQKEDVNVLQQQLVSTDEMGVMHPNTTRLISVVGGAMSNMHSSMSQANAAMSETNARLKKAEMETNTLKKELLEARGKLAEFQQHQEAASTHSAATNHTRSAGLFPFSTVAAAPTTRTITTAAASSAAPDGESSRKRARTVNSNSNSRKELTSLFLNLNNHKTNGQRSLSIVPGAGIDLQRPIATLGDHHYKPANYGNQFAF